ncbi:hypothetical protein QYF61_001430 [Mycteria americana]|uniref:Uncharacterized protein n=1 Tax=Mycteria americana TaxID=33587 RepID=A0AAN7NGT9_MYCAM|nr:hypothetical protein QYF61_001430 [Mycteria americana]
MKIAKIEVAQVDLDWQDKGELFIAWWAHDTSGHQGRDATYGWACDRGVDLTMDTIAQGSPHPAHSSGPHYNPLGPPATAPVMPQQGQSPAPHSLALPSRRPH